MQVGPNSPMQQLQAAAGKVLHDVKKIPEKIEQKGVEILFDSKNALRGLNDGFIGTISFVGSRIGVGISSETKTMLSNYRKSVQERTSPATDSLPKNMVIQARQEVSLIQNEKALLVLSKDLESQIAELKHKEREAGRTGYIKDPNIKGTHFTGEDKEKLLRLEFLQAKLAKDPGFVAEKMHEYRHDPLYLQMQPVKFLSILVKSDHNLTLHQLETNKVNPSGLSEKERVALFGYSTGDYGALNRAARQSNGNIKDPGMRDYFETVKTAYEKLPKVPVIKDKDGNPAIENKQGEPVHLKRGIENPPSQQWVDDTFVEGKTYTDHAFGSSTNDYLVQMIGTLVFKAPDGATELPHARFFGEPYTAQAGEAEILVEPGVQLPITKVEKFADGTFKAEMQL